MWFRKKWERIAEIVGSKGFGAVFSKNALILEREKARRPGGSTGFLGTTIELGLSGTGLQIGEVGKTHLSGRKRNATGCADVRQLFCLGAHDLLRG